MCISSLPNVSNLNTQSINEQIYVREDLLLLHLYMINTNFP